MESCIFSIITPVVSVTWSFRNHSKMLIWSYIKTHYQYRKKLCYYIFFGNSDCFSLFFTGLLKNVYSLIYFYTVNVLSVTLDSFNVYSQFNTIFLLFFFFFIYISYPKLLNSIYFSICMLSWPTCQIK